MKILSTKNKIDLEYIIKLTGLAENKDKKIEKTVLNIIAEVRKKGDAALVKYTCQFDKVKLKPENFKVSKSEIKQAYKDIDRKFLSTARLAIKNITQYHRYQIRSTKKYQRADGTQLQQRIRPFHRIGIYVPGGRAPLASSLLMSVIPAKVAGVKEIILTSPPDYTGRINPYILVCADLVEISEIYKIGGAQAIAAMAYGTKTIPKVDKIVGPGNAYVVEAKRQVFGLVDIDLLPGPSEILVLADSTGRADWIAADLLSQAEHTGGERIFLVTTSEVLAQKVMQQLKFQLKSLRRHKQAKKSLQYGGYIILTQSIDESIEIANLVAPEHLEIHTKQPRIVADKITSSGAIFIGPWTPEAIGDYIAGTNHILPTGGTAKMFSGLNLDEFYKKTNIVEYSEKGFRKFARPTIHFAEIEQLDAHVRSIEIRLKK